MPQALRFGTAVKLHIGPAVATDGLTAVTTLAASTVTALKYIRHGATVAVSATGRGLTHVADGHYYVSLLSGDVNTLGAFTLYVRASGTVKALPIWKECVVIPQNVYDATVSGGDRLQVDAREWAGASTATGDIALKNTLAKTADITGFNDIAAADVWTAGTRTLTSGATVAASVWVSATRTLTSAGVAWSAGTRTLTSGATVAASVWVSSARTLTSAAVAWQAATRTLTSGAAVAGSVWVSSPRTLTSAGVVWTAGTRTLTGKVTLASTTHTGAVIPTVSTVVKVTNAVTVGTNNDKTGYTLTTGQHTSIGDALLTRDMSAVAGEAARSPLNALRFLRNKWSLSTAGTLTVTKEDDTTSAWTATVTTASGAKPVTAADPA